MLDQRLNDNAVVAQKASKKHQKTSVAISSPLPSTYISMLAALVTKALTGQLPQRSHWVASAGSQPYRSASSSTMNGCILSTTFAKPQNAVIAPCFSNTMVILHPKHYRDRLHRAIVRGEGGTNRYQGPTTFASITAASNTSSTH